MLWLREGASNRLYLLAVFMGLAIVTASVFLFISERRRAQLRMEMSFKILASDQTHNFIHQVEQNLRIMDYLEVWFRSQMQQGAQANDPEVRADFQLLARNLIQIYEDIYFLAWMSRVKPEERAAGAEYFPFAWVEPAEEFRELLDSDFYSRPDYRRLMEEARDQGEMRATGPVPCPEGEGDDFDVWLFTPFYRSPVAPTSVSDRRAALSGFLVMTLDVKDMMDLALKEMASAEIDLFLLDEDAPPEHQILYHPENSPARDHREIKAVTTATAGRLPTWRKSYDLVGGRRWTMLARPRPEFLQSHVSPAPWFLLAGGIALAFMVGGYLMLLVGQTDRVRRLVGERTNQLTLEISEREQAQSRLRESEEKYRALAENAQDIIFVVDGEDRIEYVNSFAVHATGLPLEALLGVSIMAFTPDLTEEQRLKERSRLGKGQTVQGEYRALIGGRETWLDVVEVPLKNSDGRFSGYMGIARDVTQRKHLELALQQAKETAEAATRAKSEFLATMSHEIRTPMNGIIGPVGLLLDSTLSGRQRELAEIARDSAGILLALINDILDFSKMEAGKLSIEPIPFDLADVFEEVAALYAASSAQKGLELLVRYPRDVPRRVVADAGRIRQVLLNLAGNAVKFTTHGYLLLGVELEAREEERVRLRFTVQDTGSGLSEELQGRLFERFVQGDPSTTRRHGGTGLGLAISRGLVEMMGGTIGVESSPGAGATFWFRLTLPLDPAPPPVLPPPADLTGLRVLVVDDHEANRRVFVEMFAGWGLRSVAAADGAEALALLRRAAADGEPFQMALLDCQMPGMNGPALARAIKGDDDLRQTMLVMMTSFGQKGEARLMREEGFSVYLVKPVQPSQLFDLLATAWAQHLQGHTGEMLTRHSLVESKSGAFRAPPAEFSSRVLVVEDNVVNQRVAVLSLERLGCRVDVAANGREAMKMVELLPYNLVLMDCEMPEMDGFEAAREIRRREAGSGRHLPIVAMTARALQGDRERCLAAGMDDYLSKPVSLDALAAALQRHAGRREESGIAPAGRPAAAELPAAGGPEERGALVLDLRRVEELRRVAGTRRNLEHLLDCFLTSADALMERLRGAVAAGDAAELGGAAHGLKGSCANLGAAAMVPICAALDELGRGGSLDGASDFVERLEREFVLVRGALASLRREAGGEDEAMTAADGG